MARWADVERLALALPEAAEGESRGLRQWQVKGKAFEELRELVVEAWLARAPKRLAKAYAESALEH